MYDTVPVVVRLHCSLSTSITASGFAISLEKTAGMPLVIPIPRKRLRTTFANAQFVVFEISATLICEGSNLAPAPIDETIGICR